MNPEERATDTPASTNGQVSPAGLAAAGLADVQAHTPILELSGIRAAYGRIQVLHGVSLKVMPGETVVLLGANGAGKTTTISVIAGQMAPTGGDYLLAGRRVNGAAPEALARIGVCTIPEGRGVFPNLTVTENLLMASYGGRSADSIRTKAFELFPRLAERRDQPAGTMSGGEQQMLAIGRALMARPTLLLLDEPSMGLSPLLVETIFATIVQIRQQGATVLLVEQNALMALEIADRAYVLESGAITLQGTGAELASNDAVRRSYLGED